MSVRIEWRNLEEFKSELRNLPTVLAEEAGRIVVGAAERAANTVLAAYPSHTGNLRKGVGIKNVDFGPFGAGAVVYNKAPHAYWYDHGTEARHWLSGKETGAMWGKSAPTFLFTRTMIRSRTQMYGDLKDMLIRHNMTVRGDAA